MHITSVEYSELNVNDGQCAAVVSLGTDTGATHCACRVAVGFAQSVTAIQDMLLAEALRQIGRMPEYRRGQAKITLAIAAPQVELPMAA